VTKVAPRPDRPTLSDREPASGRGPVRAPDQASVTLLEVAARAQVHPSTASRALSPVRSREVSEATRRNVLAAAKALGYRPNVVARGLRKGRTGTIGVVITDFELPHNAAVLRGIEITLADSGLMPLVAETHDEPDRLETVLDHLIGRRADAVIVTSARAGDEAAVLAAARLLPVVLAVRALPGTRLPTVAHDDFEGGLLAAAHLTSLGHRRIGEIRGAQDVSSFTQRRAGFLAGLQQVGLSLAGSAEAAGMPSIGEGHRLAAQLLQGADSPLTALFAHNDVLAVGAIDALAEAGLRCPGDISVVGYDDILLADRLAPALTTIRLPSFHLGRLAAQLTRSLIDQPESPPPHVSLPPELVVRASTAPPGRGGRRR
jgi:LacI family transcriptional regulator